MNNYEEKLDDLIEFLIVNRDEIVKLFPKKSQVFVDSFNEYYNDLYLTRIVEIVKDFLIDNHPEDLDFINLHIDVDGVRIIFKDYFL